MNNYLFLLFLFSNLYFITSRKVIARFSKTVGTKIANQIRGNYPQKVISNKEDNEILEVDFTEKLKLDNNKLITISPGGFKGFYTLGVSKYIKNNYDVKDFIFSGASAGAWNALYMCKKKEEDDDFLDIIQGIDYDNFNTIYDVEQVIKHEILKKYDYIDFDFDRLFIGVTVLEKCKLTTTIYTSFETLNDAVDCCIASSHIPFITGRVIHRYKDKIVLDGGFGDYPYLKIGPPKMHISPDIWGKSAASFMDLTDLNMKQKNKNEKLKNLFEEGYLDTEINKENVQLELIK